MDGRATLGIKMDNEGTFHNRVEAEVTSVGENERFIVAKQKYKNNNEVSYYYIEKEKDDMHLNPDEISQGPFSKKQFDDISLKLGLPKFSENF